MAKIYPPMKGLSPKVRDAFESATVNDFRLGSIAIMAKLVERGLIAVSYESRKDSLGEYSIPIYSVPIPVHADWCRWCAENVIDDEFDA